MRFRSLSILGLSLLTLAGCGGSTTVSYRLTFDLQDPGSIEELTKATLRVIERRLDRLGASAPEQRITKDAEGVTVEVGTPDAESAEQLTAELTAPFDLQIMLASGEEGADLSVEGHGSFKRTGVTGDDLVNIIGTFDAETNGGRVQIRFTEEGAAKMQTIFRGNVGKNLGLFVRGQLVSLLTILNETFPTPLEIGGIPDPELAQIFADDVNVGIHVTVTPL